jgi:uncharacterized protein YcgL (UPF0745 family)
MNRSQLNVDIYRSSIKEGMYLYLEQGASLEQVPEILRKQFARGELTMSLQLTPEKKLARADASKVMATIQEQGFYLQMPPGPVVP